MSQGSSPNKTFSSFRIISRKAQKFLARAGGSEKEPRRVKLPKPLRHEEIVVHLSISSIVRATFAILAIGIGAWLVFHLRDSIILLLLGVFIATVVDPGVQTLERTGLPRGLSVLLLYFIALFFVFFLLFTLIPTVAEQLTQLAVMLSHAVDNFVQNPQISIPFLSRALNEQLQILVRSTVEGLSIGQFAATLTEWGQTLSTAAQGSIRFAVNLAGSVVNFVTSFIVVLVMAFFMQLEKESIVRWARNFLPVRYRSYLDAKSEAIHFKIGQWARGQLLLCLSIAVLTFIALAILGMPYALTLAMLAGFTELIPVIGPLIAAVPAVLIALTQEGLLWGLIIAGVYYVIQWCENNLLVPLIMKRTVGLSPIAILFAMMVGISFPETLHPVLGVILAIPFTTILKLFLEDWQNSNDE